MGVPAHLTYLLRNLYVGQEITEPDMEQLTCSRLGKEYQGCILSPCLFNLYAEYKNARLNEAQAGIKIAERKSNNLRYADHTTLMAESEEDIKSLLLKWKRRVKKFS